jgi:hypothetical protein
MRGVEADGAKDELGMVGSQSASEKMEHSMMELGILCQVWMHVTRSKSLLQVLYLDSGLSSLYIILEQFLGRLYLR